MKVLVVDGNRQVRGRVEAAVRSLSADAELIFAEDDEAGLDQFFSEEPDLVLIDVAGQGFQVLEAIRRVSDTPVIMLTGPNSETDQLRSLELGADDHIAKPFNQRALLTRMRAVLHRAELPPAS